MSATARRRGVSCNRGAGVRLTLIALACGALAASGSEAFALKIPIQATLSGAGEVPPNDSPGRGRMTGIFDTDTNTLEWTVTYCRLAAVASPSISGEALDRNNPSTLLGATGERPLLMSARFETPAVRSDRRKNPDLSKNYLRSLT